MSFMDKDTRRNGYMLTGLFEETGYDWWWHCFSGFSRSTGQEKRFFIEYFLINPALGKNVPTFGQLPENRELQIPPSYVMIKAGCWGEDARQIHRFFGWDQVQVHTYPYCVSADDCLACDDLIRGSVNVTEEEAEAHPEYMCQSGSMSWDLQVDHKVPFNVGYGAGTVFRKLKAFEMYWHAEGMKTEFAGTVTLDGEVYDVIPEKSYGYADKNWGRDFTTPWVWLSSCDLYSKVSHRKLENSVFDIGGGRPKAFGIAMDRKLLSAFCYEGKPYEFNFSKFWTGTKTRFNCKETEEEVCWHVRQETSTAMMDVVVRCQKKDMLLVNYESPKGERRHTRLWNGGNGVGHIRLYEKQGKELKLVDDMIARRIGCEYGEYEHR